MHTRTQHHCEISHNIISHTFQRKSFQERKYRILDYFLSVPDSCIMKSLDRVLPFHVCDCTRVQNLRV